MTRGTLRIYLGAAPGVGKTYAMLGELHRRRERGADAVVGLVETHGRARTAEQLGDLEVVPRRNVEYRGQTFAELDVEAVIGRRPDVVAIDEYAHTNTPGSPNEKRWQDVEEVVAAGIDVITTLNVQHLESLNDVVATVTGVRQHETVPDRLVRAADQIELVDMSPEALRRRLAHGNVYPPDRASAALASFFRPTNLGVLRELALLWMADRVEEYLGEHVDGGATAAGWETRERVVVGLTGAPSADAVIRRASRIARRVGGELIGVHVRAADGRAHVDATALDRQLALVQSLGGVTRQLVGDDVVRSLVDIARTERATQIVIGSTHQRRRDEIIRGSIANRLIRLAGSIDVHVVATTDAASSPFTPHRFGRARHRSPERRARWLGAWLVLGAGVPTLTVALQPLRDDLALSSVLLLYLSLTLGVAALGGRVPAFAAAVVSAVTVNWFFVPPLHTFTIAAVDNLVALVVFVLVAMIVGVLVDQVAVQAGRATRSRAEAELLARAAALLAADPDPARPLLTSMIATLRLDGARLVSAGADGGRDDLEVGDAREPRTEIGLRDTPDGAARALVVCGRPLTADDRRLLGTVGDQLAIALDGHEHRRAAARAHELAAIDRARTALLRAVGHDLRTPLATIKALASGLVDPAVTWREPHLTEAHRTIDEEADRLNRLIENLLDASRLETGALAVTLESTDVGDVAAQACRSLSGAVDDVVIAIDPQLPHALADRSMLERSIANLIDNARRHSPPGTPITVTADALAEGVHVCVIDRGPGIDAAVRAHATAPFQRIDDSTAGVGLGLAIVDGFVRAMGGRLVLDETPGGGLTAALVLPIATDGLVAEAR